MQKTAGDLRVKTLQDAAMNQDKEAALAAVRDFWNRRPCNIRHSAKPIGSNEYFDEVEARKYFVEPHIPIFAEFEKWRGKRVLEIGCGIGTDTMNFARAGAEVSAVDLSEKSLEIARYRAGVYGLHNIRFYEGNAEELSSFLPIERYDLIYSFGVIHHTPRPERVIEQLQRYCLPSTVLKVMVYHRHSWKAMEVFLRHGRGRFWSVSKLLERYSEAQTGCPVTHSYTRRSVRELLGGFAVDFVSVEHIFPYRVPDYVRHQYRMVWYFRHLPQPVFRWLEKRVGWHLCVTAHLAKGIGSGSGNGTGTS